MDGGEWGRKVDGGEWGRMVDRVNVGEGWMG